MKLCISESPNEAKQERPTVNITVYREELIQVRNSVTSRLLSGLRSSRQMWFLTFSLTALETEIKVAYIGWRTSDHGDHKWESGYSDSWRNRIRKNHAIAAVSLWSWLRAVSLFYWLAGKVFDKELHGSAVFVYVCVCVWNSFTHRP